MQLTRGLLIGILALSNLALPESGRAAAKHFCGQTLSAGTEQIVCKKLVSSLKPLARLKRLRVLDLQKGRIGDRELKHLRRLRTLERLRLPNSKLSGAGLKYLRKSKKSLKLLDLSNNPLKSRHLRRIGGFTNLQRIYLNKTGFGDRGLAALVRKRKPLPIVELQLADTAITNRGLGLVATFKGLAELNLRNTVVNDSGLYRLLGLKKLRLLQLEGTCWDNAGIKRLKRLMGGRGQVTTEHTVRYMDRTRVVMLRITEGGKERYVKRSVTSRRRLKPARCR